MSAGLGVSAVLFDAYGTLLDVTGIVAAEAPDLGAAAEALSTLWRRKQLEYSWLRTLMRRHADFAQVTADALDHSLEALGLGHEDRRERLLAAYRRLPAFPEAAAVLRTLRRHGLRTAVLSNGSPDMLADGLAAAGLADLLDEVLSAESVGLFKPAPEVYHLGTSRLGLAAGAIAFLSSNAWDVHGAASFGLTTIWVNRYGVPDERLPGAPVLTIPSLEPLPGVLGCA